MVIISLLILSLVLVAFVMRGAPRPPRTEQQQQDRPDITHPWSSGIAQEHDDYAGPNGVYGPGTSEPDPRE